MNKINKQILAGLLLVVALFATSSCQKEQSPTFKQTSSERMLNLIEECRNTLLANPNGWEMKYVTPVQLNNKYAPVDSFYIQMQFAEDKSVTMWADYLNEAQTSTYSFNLSNGATLAFDTYGALSVLSDAAVPAYTDADRYKGHYGEQEFAIVSVSPEKIVFRGVKYQELTELIPLQEAPSSLNNGYSRSVKEVIAGLSVLASETVLRNGANSLASVTITGLPQRLHTFYSPRNPAGTATLTLSYPQAGGAEPVVTEHTLTIGNAQVTLQPAISVAGVEHATFAYTPDKVELTSVTDPNVVIKGTVSLLTKKLTSGVYNGYGKSKFFLLLLTGMSPEMEAIAGKDKLETVFPSFAALQWYNGQVKDFSFFHEPDGKATWQSLGIKGLKVVDDDNAIYVLEAPAYLEGDQLKNSLATASQGGTINAAAYICLNFTTLGGDGQVKITETVPNKTLRLTLVNKQASAPGDLWLEFTIPN